MQPCREMPAFDPSQQIQNPQFDPNSTIHDDFVEQIFSGLPSCSPWAAVDLKSAWETPSSAADDQTPNAAEPFHYDLLASKLRHHQINGVASPPEIKAMHHPQMVIAGLANQSDVLNHQGGDATVQALFNGFGGGFLHGADTASNQNLHHLAGSAPNFGAPASVMNQAALQPSGPTCGGGGGGAPAQPKQRVRARRGQATDPHSIAERLRRERIAERMKALQDLVPNANKTDKASMLDEIIDYVKFLQLQVKVLSMSRLGGAGAVAPLVADMSSERGGDCIQTSRDSNGNNPTASSNDNSSTVTEHQVAKLMEEDMGSAMQYLQGKGLCLMPISLASAISTATCQMRNTIINCNATSNTVPMIQTNGMEGPSSLSMSVLTVQSATMGNNGGYDGSVKDATSVSKP